MSKKETKALKAKKKQTSFDIMFRVVTAVLSVAVFPVIYFMNLIYYALDWTKAMNIINSFKDVLSSENLVDGIKNLLGAGSQASQTQEITYGYISLSKLDEFKDIINMTSGQNTSLKDMIINNTGFRPLVVSFAFLALMLVLALVILVISAFANKPKAIAVISGVGSAFGVASNVVFNVFFANPLISGKTDLGKLIGSSSMVVSLIGDVIDIHYDNAFFVSVAIMMAIFIFAVSFLIVNADDKAEKALREAKKAEKKAKKAKKAAKKAEKTAKKAAEALKAEQKKEAEDSAQVQ